MTIADFGEIQTHDALDEQTLAKMYGRAGQHPDVTLVQWQARVVQGKTRLGYWAFVASELSTQAGSEIDKVPGGDNG